MPEAAAASLAVVVLGLAASLSWGLSDFGGGLASRRAPVAGVLIVVQAVGLLFALLGAAVRGEPPIAGAFAPGDVAIAGLAGALGAVGLTGLYRGLAVGRMGVVAPVGGVIATTIPVLGGIVLQGWPDATVTAGIALAIAAVILVSQVEDEEPDRPSGLSWALLAGLGMGSFTLCISRVQGDLLFGPLVIVRIVEVVVFVVAVLALRLPWRIPRGSLPALAGVGVGDVLGNVFLLASLQAGALAVAAVTSSLYPVVTAILAVFVLRERVTRIHGLGIAAAAVAIALIAGGSAG